MSDWNWISFYIGTIVGAVVAGGLLVVYLSLLLCGPDESEVSEFPTEACTDNASRGVD